MKIRRYLMAAVLAEVIGLACLWLAIGLLRTGAHQQQIVEMLYQSTPYDRNGRAYCNGSLLSSMYLKPEFQGCWLIKDRALCIAGQLDFVDNALPSLVGFPAITVFALRTFDRQRKQKPRDSVGMVKERGVYASG
jgi:hypothetical protein